MLWLKRNIVLLIGIFSAVAFLTLAVIFMIYEYNDYVAQDIAVTQRLEGIKTLKSYNPQPSEENILVIKNNTSLIKKFMVDADGLFLSVTNQKLDSQRFLVLIDNTIAELTKEATNSSVTLPPRYMFTFGGLKGNPNVAITMIEPLTVQIEEIKAICGVLFRAKIAALQSLQRTPVHGEQQASSSAEYLIGRSVVTNNYGIVVPYRVSFRCFSPELAGVLNGFAGAAHFMVVRTLTIQPADGSGGDATPGNMPGMNTGMTPGTPMPANPAPTSIVIPGVGVPQSRPGLPPNPKPGTTPGANTVAKSNKVKVLDEKPLLVTMDVDIIKPYKGPKLSQMPAAAVPGASAEPSATPPKKKRTMTPPATTP